jgi:nucleoside-triphosphatase
MSGMRQLILWTGPKHAGKTTTVLQLVEAVRRKGLVVGGVVAPSVRRNGRLVGFNCLDLGTGKQAALARLGRGHAQAGRFNFQHEGLQLGTQALSPAATRNADLIVVDEYGPFELANGGWRKAVDRLMACRGAPILMIVRQELTDQVAQVYPQAPCRQLPANDPDSITKVIAILEGKISGDGHANRRSAKPSPADGVR